MASGLCGVVVLVDEAAEDGGSADAVGGQVGDRRQVARTLQCCLCPGQPRRLSDDLGLGVQRSRWTPVGPPTPRGLIWQDSVGVVGQAFPLAGRDFGQALLGGDLAQPGPAGRCRAAGGDDGRLRRTVAGHRAELGRLPGTAAGLPAAGGGAGPPAGRTGDQPHRDRRPGSAPGRDHRGAAEPVHGRAGRRLATGMEFAERAGPGSAPAEAAPGRGGAGAPGTGHAAAAPAAARTLRRAGQPAAAAGRRARAGRPVRAAVR